MIKLSNFRNGWVDIEISDTTGKVFKDSISYLTETLLTRLLQTIYDYTVMKYAMCEVDCEGHRFLLIVDSSGCSIITDEMGEDNLISFNLAPDDVMKDLCLTCLKNLDDLVNFKVNPPQTALEMSAWVSGALRFLGQMYRKLSSSDNMNFS